MGHNMDVDVKGKVTVSLLGGIGFKPWSKRLAILIALNPSRQILR
jgi:hypothetical protein